MSEYQYIAFRAVDRPLTDKELEFAHTQSSRAEISRWSFENEYHYGDFSGDPEKLLRGGYDVHLHYANFGVRRVLLRLPHGMSLPKKIWSAYVSADGFTWTKDRKGKGGILSIEPFHDAGSIDEIWEPAAYMDDLVELRNRLMQGDLRALYLIWLCIANGDDANPDQTEPPVPLGLDQLLEPCGDVLDFFGLDPLMLVAASEGTPALRDPPETDPNQIADDWVRSLSEQEARECIRRLIAEDATAVKAELLAKSRQALPIGVWPTETGTRSFQMLLGRSKLLRDDEIRREQRKEAAKAKREAKKAERQRQKRMQQMVNEPNRWLREADTLVNARGTANYKAAAELLADLREAIGGDQGQQITRQHASHLAKTHPTLTHLKSSLRKRNLID
jgi:hypothetical protein